MAKKTQKILLSEHTLDINTNSYDVEQFDFSEIEEYVKKLTGDRVYQFEAIKNILIYLWGERYDSILDLAKENYKKAGKEGLRQRFESKDHFLSTLPLPDRLSGVCHMATGTGKSYVMFAVAYLSIVMDKVDRVLVIGPSSTVIEAGLNEKFNEYLFGEIGNELKEYLPFEYRNKVVNLLNANDPIEDQSIIIENVNAVYTEERNAIGDTLFKRGNRVLVLSDEVHHAYSHLKFAGPNWSSFDFDPDKIDTTKTSGVNAERLWMKFLREKDIKWHIGFTGTPYNQDEYFSDVIYNYSLKDAIEEKYIKKIDPVIKVDGDDELTKANRFDQIIKTHLDNKKLYSYPDKFGNPKLKPITIFINNQQSTAKKNAAEFIKALAIYYEKYIKEYKNLSKSELEVLANLKVIVVTSDSNKAEYQKQLEQIEEVNPEKVGGQVEFIFAVNKLSEGWDVDNVFQIVPAEERVFNSKLLISQVLGRGLRLPRNVSQVDVLQNYPSVTITNHEKFGNHVKELYEQVTNCEMRFTSVILDDDQERSKHNFNVFNISYVPHSELEDKKESTSVKRSLKLDPQQDTLKVKIEYLEGTRKFEFDKEFVTVDQLVSDINRKLKNVAFEHSKFDFEDDFHPDLLPTFESIKKQITEASFAAGITGNKISIDNKKKIELYFNQFISRGTKKPVRKNIEGSLYGISTKSLPSATINVGRLDSEASIFISEDFVEELHEDSKFILSEIEKQSKKLAKKKPAGQASLLTEQLEISSPHIRQYLHDKNIFLVNTSLFKTPQSAVLVTHRPEREFIFKLIDSSKLIDGWIKSPDTGFYSLQYEFWKKGKDKVKRSFNPDFIIKTSVDRYYSNIKNEAAKNKLRKMEESGLEEIIFVVEIKGKDDYKEETIAKEKDGAQHFESVNKSLLGNGLTPFNPSNLDGQFRESYRQHYVFNVLRFEDFSSWFKRFEEGTLVLE